MADITSNTETVETAAAHAHIDFNAIDFTDPESIANIDLESISCEACLEFYAEHFAGDEAEADDDLLAGIEFNPQNFVSNLGYMGTGMVGIFIVIALIMGVTTVLNKAFSAKKDEE